VIVVIEVVDDVGEAEDVDPAHGHMKALAIGVEADW
jgi:hypothetical protein